MRRRSNLILKLKTLNLMTDYNSPEWQQDSSSYAMAILEDARKTGRPVVLLTGAGISADSGFPLAMELKDYFVQARRYVSHEGYSNFRQYIEEARWPSRHDLRVDLMLKAKKLSLTQEMLEAEQEATQAALVAELRRDAPSLAFSLQEIFELLNPPEWKSEEIKEVYKHATSIAESLGKRSPKNIAYRSLLANLCDNNQTTIDACFDHFIRDREPTTTHQFIYFLSQVLCMPVIFTTNFDPLLENAFSGEGLQPRVYEVRGEESIPSARLLLSQSLSIVKLHGGTHQMQTGFNLDDPLSPAALSAFNELYERLQKIHGQPPLTLVMGYSGSDRRVMDIVASQVREWAPELIEPHNPLHKAGRPRILWVSRVPWIPEQLNSAVKTHPYILQGHSKAGKPQFPVHLVRYRDGRLFLLESLQTLLRHFPIAKSHYQAVNFVVHSVSGRDRSSENARHFVNKNKNWRIALIHTASGGGSSSTLVNVSETLENSDDCRVIWIDLTEIAGVSALIDVISERITKLDTRLQPVRRPPLLSSLLNTCDAMEETNFATASREHEMLSSVQWLRHAMRRGKYLIALDSLDEFPCEHPAMDHESSDQESSKSIVLKQRRLMFRLIKELSDRPELLGDSRIALALSSSNHRLEGVSDNLANNDPEPLEELASYLKRQQNLDSLVRAPMLESTPLRATPWHESLKEWGSYGTSNPDNHASVKSNENGIPELSSKDSAILRPFIYAVIVIVSSCCRRVRSEVLLRRCVGEYIGRLSPALSVYTQVLDGSTTQDDSENRVAYIVSKLKESNNNNLISSWINVTENDDISHPVSIDVFKIFDGELSLIWEEPSPDRQHLSDRAIPKLDPLIRRCIHELCGHAEVDEKVPSTTVGKNRQWLYRTEGAYHWMHRDLRNGLYNALKAGGRNEPLAMAHHVTALFCYDELYERSRDARAFLEYLFHRVASIQLAINDTNNKIRTSAALSWTIRLLISLHREKHAMLTRVRLPGFIRQITQLRNVVSRLRASISEEEVESQDTVREQMGDLLRLLSDFLLASGHPHSAFLDGIFRLKESGHDLTGGDRPTSSMIFNKNFVDNVSEVAAANLRSLNEKLNEKLVNNQPPLEVVEDNKTIEVSESIRTLEVAEGIRTMAIFRDLAYSCHDPILSPVRFPMFPRSDKLENGRVADWVALMAEKSKIKDVATREDRIKLCRNVYRGLAELREGAFKRLDDLQPWTQPNQAGDFFGGMVRKSLEFRMIFHAESWIDSSKVYLDTAPTASERLKAYCDARVAERMKDENSEEEDHAEGARKHRYRLGELGGDQPLLRRSRRRQRHECYRLCLRARLKGATALRVINASEVNRMLLSPEGIRAWEKIRRRLDDAESILNRSGGFAEQQAMAITRLTCAELLVRRAEVLCWGANDKEALPAVAADLKLVCSQTLGEAFSMLSTVAKLMNEGRGENRWRFFYLLTRSRAYLLRAFIRKDTAQRLALSDMSWAGRNLAGAINNCGLWTDRYDILLWWWDTWKEVAKSIHGEGDDLERYLALMSATLGVRWNTERSANRFGRDLRGSDC